MNTDEEVAAKAGPIGPTQLDRLKDGVERLASEFGRLRSLDWARKD